MNPDNNIPARRSSKAARIVVLLAALVGVAVTARLGVWQLDRAAQKIALQAQMDERAQAAPVPAAQLAQDEATAAQQWQRPATLRGWWLPQGTVFLDNRTMDGRAGFLIVTPLLLADGHALLVQRGWAPRDATDRTRLPPIATPAEEVQLQGRLAPWPSQLLQLGASETGAIRQNLDRDAFGRELRQPLLPLTLQLMAAPTPVNGNAAADDGLLRHWWVPTADVSKHHGYAVQWFALAALIAGLYVWFQLVRPRRHAQPRA